MPNGPANRMPPGMPKKVLEAGTGRPIAVSRYLAEFQGEPEVVKWSLYDILPYPAAGALRFAFFQAAGANLTISNMQGNGQLPAPQIMVVESIGVKWLPDAANAVAENVGVLQNGALEFLVSHKPYHQGAPLSFYSTGYGPFVATAAATTHVNNGWPTRDAAYKLTPYAVAIPPNRFFIVEVTFAALAAVTGVLSRIGVDLNGYLIRPIQ